MVRLLLKVFRDKYKELSRKGSQGAPYTGSSYNDIPPPLDDFEEIGSPYLSSSWHGATWHCIRCGSKLEELPETADYGGAWKAMQANGYLLYRCTNEQCCHHEGYLTLHHPHSTERGPGESYSVSWIR